MGSVVNFSEFHVKLKLRRKELGFTQNQLAQELGVSEKTVKDWEHEIFNHSGMKLGNLIRLCKVLNCDVSYFLTDQVLPTKEATDIQKETRLSAAAAKKIVEMGSRNQWYALRGLDALLRYDNGWLLDKIGEYITSQKETVAEMPDRSKIPMHFLYAKIIENELAVLRSKIQAGELKWPEDTSPNGDDAYIWVRR